MAASLIHFHEPLRPNAHLRATVKYPYESAPKGVRMALSAKDFLVLSRLVRTDGRPFTEITFETELVRGVVRWAVSQEGL